MFQSIIRAMQYFLALPLLLAGCQNMAMHSGMSEKASEEEYMSQLQQVLDDRRLSAALRPLMETEAHLSPLHIAVLNNDEAALAELLRSGEIDVNIKEELHGNTPLHFAADNGHVQMVRRLLAAGARVNVKNRHKNRPIHLVANCGDTEIAEMLLEAGARRRINARGDSNNTPLHFAADKGFQGLIALFLREGARLGLADIHGMTPLHVAAFKGYQEITAMLMEAGADPHRKSRHGLTAIDSAQMGGHVVLALQLQRAHTAATTRSQAAVNEEVLSVNRCANCNQEASNRCGACRQVFYCSRRCQRKHWRTHREDCQNQRAN